MRTDTVYDMLRQLQRDFPNDFEQRFRTNVLGKIVLTKYNKRSYKVDDVDFTITPNTTFNRRGVELTIKQYYLEVRHYIIFDEIEFLRLLCCFLILFFEQKLYLMLRSSPFS